MTISMSNPERQAPQRSSARAGSRPVRGRLSRRQLLGLGAGAMLLAGCRSKGPSSLIRSGRPLEIWWSQGYYPEEADAIEAIVSDWQQRSGGRVHLSFFSESAIEAKASSILRGGPQPDILYGYGLNETVLPLLAWKGMLADLSAQLKPLTSQLVEGVVQAVSYRNNLTGQRGIYAAPVAQQACNIHYWRDLLAELDTSPDLPPKIPQSWQEFWLFWQHAQPLLRLKGFTDVYGVGLPMSPLASDTSNIFEYFLQAHGAALLDDQGRLQVEDQGVRERIAAALSDYTSSYLGGFVPPDASQWSDVDNNISFLSSLSLMTVNPTLSIPGSQTADETTYYERIRTIPWPQRLDGQPMEAILSVKQLVVLKACPDLDLARDFVSFFLQPDNTDRFLQGGQGRFLPVLRPLLKSPVWSNPQDPHLRVALQILERRRESNIVLNPAYSEVFKQNVWGLAIHAIVKEKIPVGQATEDAINSIRRIFEQWG
ncbi:ABC transporter substrate-binding protein [Synechococcus sp. EJ6-Ellesmere]|uniref:ABC transporter substrate-binding protein n=1 Tax=Synechococcus sp. EJ6-Ellesmere TaxID=2823734 RepID=UPI0020CE155A|nr:ABC transporter substrate-binding protein [Synechococcus sp. EJ6-Ellesmere]MCP9825347.1 carbohydrate ABC transporter substrate-binding protein [Synechococcus sp. EJ6-Ellesmere]